MRGPVGSLGSPEGEEAYERCEGGGLTLLVHREALAEAEVPGVLRFHFGAFGWCEARLTEREVEMSGASGEHPDEQPAWLADVARLRELRPRHLLFLCVANSARSQMAEGIARALAPAGVCVSSAGSAPASVRPQAVQVLAELGIDISSHRSKAIAEIEAESVDAVITLCAEEVCPVFLGRAARVHWGLPDPAAAPGGEAEALRAFRAVRDELRRRLQPLFAAWPVGSDERRS